MHISGSLRYTALILIAILSCTGIAGAAQSDHPVVTGIIGPNNLDNGYGPTGSYTFIASVSGGSPPYTYKWMNPAGVKTLFEGKDYASVKIPANQLGNSGAGRYGVWLTVTDSAGKDAVFAKAGGTGNSNQYFYGLTYTDYPVEKWTVITEPATFPVVKDAPAPAAVVTTDSTCVKAARFSGVSGQVEVSHEGKPDDRKTAKIDTVLCEGDTIETDEDASCIIAFADMSSYVMKPETTIILTKSSGPESKLKLVAGNIWMNIKKMVKDGSMEVETSQGICGIRGTTFVLSSDAGHSALQVIEGSVSMTGKADGKTVLVSTGQQVTATPQGLGTPASFDPASVTAEWEAVKAKTQAGSPAAAPTRKASPGPAAILAGLGMAAAILAVRRLR